MKRKKLKDSPENSQKNLKDPLKQLRTRIDRADRALLKALSERFSVVERIGRFKIARGLPFVVKARWHELLSDRLAQGGELGLDPKFVRALFRAIHAESVRIQRRLKRNKRD